MVSFEYQPIPRIKYIIYGVHLVNVDKIRRFYSTFGNALHFQYGKSPFPLNEYENGPAGTFIHPAACREGFEPRTSALQGQRSSTELQAHYEY